MSILNSPMKSAEPNPNSTERRNRFGFRGRTLIATLTPLFMGPEAVVTIFIHGYRALHSRSQFDTLATEILSARPPGRLFLLYWKSGDWKAPVMTHALLALGRTALRVLKRGRLLSPVALLTDAAIFTAGEIARFSYYENRAERLGRALRSHIEAALPGPGVPLNLIGHSFGARVIHYALAHEDWSGLLLNDCVFLAGAADLLSDNWAHCLDQLHGRLYNAYSPKDLALKMTPDLRKRVGRYPIPTAHPRLVNRCYPSFQHKDYWPHLGVIFKQLWSGYQPSPHVPRHVSVENPASQNE